MSSDFGYVELDLARQEVAAQFIAIDLARYADDYGLDAMRDVIREAELLIGVGT